MMIVGRFWGIEGLIWRGSLGGLLVMDFGDDLGVNLGRFWGCFTSLDTIETITALKMA